MKKLLELTKTGVHMSGGEKITVTKKDLAEVVKTFKGSVPLVIGHNRNEALPKMGDTLEVALKDGGNTLVGIVDFNEIGSELYEKKLYDNRSVTLVKNADGEYYIRDVAFLGDVAPAVKGMKDWGFLDSLNLSDRDIETVQLSEPAEKDTFIILSSAGINPKKEKGNMEKTAAELAAEIEKQKSVNESLKKQNELLLSDKDKLAEREKAEWAARIKKAAEGKIPAGKMPELIALADSLPAETVEIIDSEGKKETVTPAVLLERIISTLKDLVESSEVISLSDNGTASGKKEVDLSGLMACM